MDLGYFSINTLIRLENYQRLASGVCGVGLRAGFAGATGTG
jgi:hypothetical protein